MIGEVVDHTTGLPLSGAGVKVEWAHGEPLSEPMETWTTQGQVVLNIDLAGFESSDWLNLPLLVP